MTTKVWRGQAPAVAQVDEIGVTAYDASTQYQLLVNGEIIVAVSGGGTVGQVASALASGWNAVTGNPYSRPITALATGSDVRLTADIPGNSFIVSANATGGTGTIGTATGVTANAGPHVWSTPANWSGGSVPVTGDDVFLRDSDVAILFGLAQSGIVVDSIASEASYTGDIGLNQRQVVTGAGGAASAERPEYRDHYLDIGWTECRIGEVIGPGDPAGSGRLKLDNAKAGASTTTIFKNSAAGTDSNQPNVRLLFANAGADVLVRSGAGGVGIAIDDPAETSTVGSVSVSDDSQATQLFIGEGVTLADYAQQGGDNILRSAAAVTGISVLGGILRIEGSGYTITDLTVEGGTVFPNSTPTGGNAITTVNIDGGIVDGTASREPRTWGTVNLGVPGSTLKADDDVITITTLNEPDGPYSLSIG